MCAAINATENAAHAIMMQKSENRINITPLLPLSSVAVCTLASISGRKLDGVESSAERPVLVNPHSSVSDIAEIASKALSGAF
jgi:hypothetical protein